MKRATWLFHLIRWNCIRVIHKLTGKYLISKEKYGKYTLYGTEAGNAIMRQYLAEDKPFAFGRYSFVEMDLVQKYITETKFGIRAYAFSQKGAAATYKLNKDDKYNGVRKFSKLMLESIAELDMVGVWPNLYMGDAVLEVVQARQNMIVTDARALEPYSASQPWMEKLRGKKVLVVSPFDREIQQQYAIREKLWVNENVLPKFDLITVKSVWYFDGMKDSRFANWFEALDCLYQEVIKHDFDVALLSCGPFGLPLATMLKQYGRQAIHMGGTLQILFGIKGKRWDDIPSISKLYNEYWIRPGEESRPNNAGVLDDSCYW